MQAALDEYIHRSLDVFYGLEAWDEISNANFSPDDAATHRAVMESFENIMDNRFFVYNMSEKQYNKYRWCLYETARVAFSLYTPVSVK